MSEISSASRGLAWDDSITITSWFSTVDEKILPVNAERKEQRRLAKIRVPLVPVVHLSSRKEGREDTGIPCIGASILRDVVDPRGGDDLLSPACAAVCKDSSKTGEIARGRADATRSPRRPQSVDRDVRAVLRTHRLPDVSAHQVGKSLTCRPLDHPAQ